jgi:hypothetical protein
MASGITHILLMKELQGRLPEGVLKHILAASRDFLQVGAVAPDLPYASIGDDDLFFSVQTEFADRFHYEKTDEVPLAALRWIRALKNEVPPPELRALFAFFVGYMSHIAADGLIHPFVRDKVGDYKGNETEHRRLEMQLDVLFYHDLTAPHGALGELNYSNPYDELKNVLDNPLFTSVLHLFAEVIQEVYGSRCEPGEIAQWVKGLHRMFGVAEGRHLVFYRNFGPIRDFFFPDYEEIAAARENILTLAVPVDREVNFLRKERVHFLEDIIPRFYECFIPVALRAFEYVYREGPELTKDELPPIDLDTGRLLGVHNNLDVTPAFWGDRA